jgi:hypothetical protein
MKSQIHRTIDQSCHARSGYLRRPYRHVGGRCAVNLAVRLDLPYACARSYTRTEVASDSEAAPIAQLENVKAAARERLAGSPVCALRGLCGHWLTLFKEPGT